MVGELCPDQQTKQLKCGMWRLGRREKVCGAFTLSNFYLIFSGWGECCVWIMGQNISNISNMECGDREGNPIL
jgi:hypothetical protein